MFERRLAIFPESGSSRQESFVLQDEWVFQEEIPVRESRYSLQLPGGWEYKASWLNYGELKPTQGTGNEWHWIVKDVKAVRKEADMPPFRGVLGHMIVSFIPPGGLDPSKGYSTWKEMGNWYRNLTNGRFDASPDIRQKTAALAGQGTSQLEKMKALAQFVQQDVRYVAIELGIGGWQPHPAADVFKHHYGDCKDKAPLMRSMLHEVGVESYLTRDAERIKPIESLLADSLANFHILKASVVNLQQADKPFGYNYTFIADEYAQSAGNLLLVRPRVLGTKAQGILETKEPCQFPIEFEGPVRDTDRFEITVPPGYEVDELPPPVDVDYSFASYHSKTEANGNVIGYTRVFELKELSVPVSKAEELKKFYRIIAGDERSTAVLKPAK